MPSEKVGTRLSLIVLAGYLLLLLNLFRMQVLRGHYYYELSEKNRIRVVYLEGPRGKVLDRNGLLLATNRLSFDCTVIPREAKRSIVRSCESLSPILGVAATELEKRFLKRRPGAFNSVVMAENLTLPQAMAIEERLDTLPGFMVETRPQREYPYGETAAHLVGYTGPVTADELDTLEASDYQMRDWIGREGVEKSYEGYVRGFSGGRQIEVDSRGRIVRALGVKEPREGRQIQLTVDMKLQAYAQKLLAGRKGCVVAMDLRDGGVLALANAPSYDPNLFASRAGRAGVGHYLIDTDSPLLDRAIGGIYPPGSIFKIVTAMAALDRRRITSSTAVNCAGSLLLGRIRFRCWNQEGHGPQALVEAFAHSCNVYFFTIGLWAGSDAIYEKALAFGFARATGIDLPGEKSGLVPTRDRKRRLLNQPWFEGDTANLAIGQGSLLVTPVQALRMIAAVATDGQLYRPHVIDKIGGIKVGDPGLKPIGLSFAHLSLVRQGLDSVVNSDTGTGRLSRVPGLRVAGKTGTAQSGKDRTHAWFVGYAPERSPKVALVVFLEHGGRGGVAAARLASAMLERIKGAGYC